MYANIGTEIFIENVIFSTISAKTSFGHQKPNPAINVYTCGGGGSITGVGLLACYEVWVCGRLLVHAPDGAIVGSFSSRKLVRFSLLKCPSIPNSKFGTT